jgi:copper chaperone CopZ
MERRRFVQMITLAGAGSLALAEAAKHGGGATRTVAYHVKGFTCPTCAVGLETLLGRQKGVRCVTASYPDAHVVIRYDPGSVTEGQLRALISELGFTAEPAPAA